MSPVYATVVGVAAFWLQITIVPWLAPFDVKPNLLLVTVFVLALRWVHPWMFVYAALAGISQDAFSHGILGVYGLSFLAAAAMANLTGKLVFDQNILFTSLVVIGLSVLEGLISLMILDISGSRVAWVSWLFGRVLPQSLLQGLVTIPVIYGLNAARRLIKV